MIKNIIFLLFVIPSLTLYSKTIYVSKQGDDSNNGEINSPLLTIQKALDMLAAGDTFRAAAGLFPSLSSVSDLNLLVYEA